MLRFATTPTCDMDIGTLRIAILTYLLSQKRQERFGVRIDDINKNSIIEGKDTEIMQILEKFALIHDSVFHQSEHLHMHQTLAIKLLEEDKAFVCTCQSNQCKGGCEKDTKSKHTSLKEKKIPFVIRLNQPSSAVVFQDIIQGKCVLSTEKIDSFIILDTEGHPSADFASACDDMLSNITMHIHEDTHLLHTARQIHIQKQLGFNTEIDYAHIPSFSYTQNDTTVKWLFEQGYIPDAIINVLLFLGNSKVPKKIFTMPEVISWFKLEDISSKPIQFDINIAKDINKKHLRNMANTQLSTLFGFADEDIGRLVKLYLDEASTINELALKIRPIFAPKDFEGEWKEEMKILQSIIVDAPMIHEFEAFKTYLMQNSKLRNESFTQPLRLLLTGALHGPELSDIYPLIKPYLLEVAS